MAADVDAPPIPITGIKLIRHGDEALTSPHLISSTGSTPSHLILMSLTFIDANLIASDRTGPMTWRAASPIPVFAHYRRNLLQL